MSTRDVTDEMVCEAYREYHARRGALCGTSDFPYDILMERTGLSFKECYRAMERAARRDLIEYGVSLRTGWLTEKGEALISTRP